MRAAAALAAMRRGSSMMIFLPASPHRSQADSGASLVEVQRLGTDDSDVNIEFDPGNPAADEKGMVKMPNVNILIEMADMREANRAYEANLQTVKQSRDLISQTIDLLRASQ